MKIRHLTILITCIIFSNCSGDRHDFPLDKMYWDINDYDKVVFELNYNYEIDEVLPSFDNPNNNRVVEKLTDERNYQVVLDDNELGLKHRNEVAEHFFKEWKDMNRIYQSTDRMDQYLYDKEMIAVWHFGLGLQLKYFDLGNQLIQESADDPTSLSVKRNVNSNINTLIDNYLIYMDLINNESSFSELGKEKLALGIKKYFKELIDLYPDANYDNMKKKAVLMLKKTDSEIIQQSLNELLTVIENKDAID